MRNSNLSLFLSKMQSRVEIFQILINQIFQFLIILHFQNYQTHPTMPPCKITAQTIPSTPKSMKGHPATSMQTPLNMDTGDVSVLSTPVRASDAPSISSPSSKAKPAGTWKFDSELALLEMAEELGLWIHQHGKMEAHYVAIADELRGRYGLVRSVISLRCKYNVMLDVARKQAAADAKATGETQQLDAVQLLAAKLAALEDDSKALSEVSLFLGLFFFNFTLGTKERGVVGGRKGT